MELTKKRIIYGSAVFIALAILSVLTINLRSGEPMGEPSYHITVEGELDKSNSALNPQPLSELYIVDRRDGCIEGEKLATIQSGLNDGSDVSFSYSAKRHEVQDQQPAVRLNPDLIRFCATTETGSDHYQSITDYDYQSLNATAEKGAFEGAVALKEPEFGGSIMWEIDLTDFSMQQAIP